MVQYYKEASTKAALASLRRHCGLHKQSRSGGSVCVHV